MTEPLARQIGRAWFISFPNDRDLVTFEVRRMLERSEGCWGEISAVTAKGLARWEPRLNFYAATQRASFAKACEATCSLGRWPDLVEAATRALLKARMQLPPPIRLEPTPPLQLPWLVPGWVPAGQVTTLFGDGGSGKSLFALALALAGLTGKPLGEQWRVTPLDRVLYLDWEATAEEHSARLWSLLTGEFEGATETTPAIDYQRLRRPLADLLDALLRQTETPYPLIIIDSALFAASGELDTADSAMGLYAALGELAPATVVVIGHVSKLTAEQGKGEGRMYGSVQHRNAPRSSIEFKAHDLVDPLDRTVSCYHRKLNTFGGLQGEAAFRFLSDEAGHTLVRPGMREGGGLSTTAQILECLRRGTRTTSDIHDETGIVADTIKRTLNRLAEKGTVVRVTGSQGGRSRETSWGLPASVPGQEQGQTRTTPDWIHE